MSKLERWNPFKFRRKNKEDKHRTDTTASVSEAPVSRGLALSPMSAWLQSVMREPMFREPFAMFGDTDRWFGDFAPTRFQPAVDVVDENGALRVTAELPGLDKEDIKLEIDDNQLTIRGEKRHQKQGEEDGAFRTERYYGYFERVVPLPADLERDRAEASFENGVLSVRLPKSAPKEDEVQIVQIH